MTRASSTTAKALAAAIAGAEIMSPLGFGAAAQEVKVATRPECVNPTGAWISACAIAAVREEAAEARRRGEQARREGEQAMIATGCANFLRDNMGKTFTKDQLMAWLGNPKTREEFRAEMDRRACKIAKDQGYTGPTAQMDAQPR